MIHSAAAYKIAINLIPGIGDITIRKLVAYCGSLEGVFQEKKSHLIKIPGISEVLATNIITAVNDKSIWERVEKELKFCEKYRINIICFTDSTYPYRLSQCEDAPVTIFTLGNLNLNASRMLSIVGTRKATNYGKRFCENIITEFAHRKLDVTIVSGLAFGIDICAHTSAIDNNLPTIAVLAHGLDTIYPPQHKKYVKNILEKGGLVTEFLTGTQPDRHNFVKRNRIIAALSDATLVVESRKDGGAMITANLAFDYNRDVLALPGRIHDTFSEGPNYLIKTNRAIMVENVDDICKTLGWDVNMKSKTINSLPIFYELSEDEQKIVSVLKEEGDTSIDVLAIKTNLPVSKVSVLLFNLEFNGIVDVLPGKIYTLKQKV